MTDHIAVITTFGNQHWECYAKDMLQSFVRYWPPEVQLLIQLDDDLLANDVQKIIRPQDGLVCGRMKDHHAFVERNKAKDDPNNYRKQAVRFCHKVFALKHACESVMKAREEKIPDAPRYLIWMDADVITTSPVKLDLLKECLPKEGDAVSYLGRKDWEHSECGWLAFDLDNGGDSYVKIITKYYLDDEVFKQEQWHDSWIFDQVKDSELSIPCTNLTQDKPGMEIWQHSPMAKFSTHYKGPQAKQQLMVNKIPLQERTKGVTIITKNSIPNELIHEQIEKNNKQIKQWVKRCLVTDRKVTVVSAGLMMVPEDIIAEKEAGHFIVAVKHALKRLKEANVKPDACILLDPRPHVYDFVDNPDKDIIWFVASQVHPSVVEKLLENGCNVWGYHAPVGAGELELFKSHYQSVIPGGSASATRGLFLLEALGFRKFRLFGYELCLHKKPDMNTLDDKTGSPKYLSMTIGAKSSVIDMQKDFWTEGQLAAQIQELKDLVDNPEWDMEAFGFGVMPFLVKTRQVNKLREKAHKAKMLGENPLTCEQLLTWPIKQTKSSMLSPNMKLKTRLRQTKARNS